MKRGVPLDKLSDASGMSMMAGITMKCVGDFCLYDEDEELKIMSTDSDINFKSQVRKARQQYQKIIGGPSIPNDSEDEKENITEDMLSSAFELGFFQNPNGEMKIPQKSIELAREEILAFDSLNEDDRHNVISTAFSMSSSEELRKNAENRLVVAWPAPLLSWWNR